MDQVRQRFRRLMKSEIRKRLVGSGQNAMVCGAGVGDDLDVTLRHMAAYAVVGRLLLHSSFDRQLTTLIRVACETFGGEILRRLFRDGST